ncbi:hypothetical protein JOC78_002278 [Bacillus ectoiniformans]|nr:hypothetical protein [Bacillus ectoiniformans]
MGSLLFDFSGFCGIADRKLKGAVRIGLSADRKLLSADRLPQAAVRLSKILLESAQVSRISASTNIYGVIRCYFSKFY